MASRLALRALRPSVRPQTLVRPMALSGMQMQMQMQMRGMASQPQNPDEKAASIINSVPSSSLWTKTGGVVLGTAVTAAAISTELYVVNHETVLAVGFFIVVAAIGRFMGGPYSEWANGHINRIKSILDTAKTEHASAVRERITSVESLKQVVPLTEQLYAVARETAQLEHENFLLAQEQAVKSEAKAVLDSWVRFEQQQREKEQGDLVRSVREGIEGRLGDRAFRQQLLEEALGQVEQLAKSKAI